MRVQDYGGYLITRPRGQAKLKKGKNHGRHDVGVHFNPYKLWILGKLINFCAGATPGCIQSCLNKSGHGEIFKEGVYDSEGNRTNSVLEARKVRSRLYWEDKAGFMQRIKRETESCQRQAKKLGLELVIRPNLTSDLAKFAKDWGKLFPDIQMYDYTKLPRPEKRITPKYHLTFSLAETKDNQAEALRVMRDGICNVSVVFKLSTTNPQLPLWFRGRPVLDGDNLHGDLRFLDPPYHYVGLKLKGRAQRKLKTSFILDATSYDPDDWSNGSWNDKHGPHRLSEWEGTRRAA